MIDATPPTDGKLRVLFVDDEPMVLSALRRNLRPQRDRWDMAFADGGANALDLLAKRPFDVIVSDMRMPGIDGAELLGRVRDAYPGMIRFVLSGFSEQEMTVKLVNTAHQYLSKPCEMDELVRAVDRAVSLRALLRDVKMTRAITKLHRLPSPPDVYHRLTQQVADPACRIEDIAETLGQDPAMTAKVLQLVNSSFFGFTRQISEVHHAVSLLGLNLVHALVLSIHAFEAFDGAPPALATLQPHSFRTAWLAKGIVAQQGGESAEQSHAFTAGLLHDLGKLLLATSGELNYPGVFDESIGSGRPLHQVEAERLGASHAEAGAYLLALWNLPDPVIEAVAYHHRPSDAPPQSFGTLAAVHAADALDRRVNPSANAMPAEPLDEAYLESLGLRAEVSAWIKLAQADAKATAEAA